VASLRILHVVATGQHRGAEMFAHDLIGALLDLDQRVALLRRAAGPTIRFLVPTDTLAEGRLVPGLRLRPAAVLGLRDVIDEWDPHVVHAHGGEPLKYAVLAARGRPARVLYRRIGTAPPAAHRWLRRTAHARLMLGADTLVAVAESVARETIEVFGIPRERVVTIPRGVDPRRIRPTRGRDETRRMLGIEPEEVAVLSLGAITREKDPIEHVGVVAALARRHVVHLIAGDGPLRPAMERAVEAAGLGDRSRFLGVRPDVGNVLAAADVMLLASRTEGMPGCLIEAGMASLPSAAYDVAGVGEVIEDRITGLLAPPGDRDALAAALGELVDRDEDRRDMGRAARERCMDRFGIGAIGALYRELYETLAGRSAVGSDRGRG
jgi:glycosyltransferase involved in cell wall biosynthesis